MTEWRDVKVGTLVKERALAVSDGYRVRNVELGPSGIPFVRGGDIGDGWINTTTADHIRSELAQRVNAKLAIPGDVAFITKGSVGRSGWLRAGQPPVVFAPQVTYWRSLNPSILDPRFLFYLTKGAPFQAALYGVKTHGSMVADYVSLSQQLDFEFRIPDIERQRTAGRVLGALDDKIELNRRMSETLESMARALFKSWFVDFDPVRAKMEGRESGLPKHLADLFPNRLVDSELGEIPEGWELKSLDQIARFLNGLPLQKYPPADSGRSLPVIKIAQLRVGRADGADRSSADIDSNYIVADGDILFSWSGSLECVVWAGGRGALNQHLFKVTSTEYPRWLCYFGIHHHLEDFRQIAAGKATTMGHIQRHHLSDAKVAFPPKPTASAIDQCLSALFERSWKHDVESRTVAAVRDALLPRLISGELRVPAA